MPAGGHRPTFPCMRERKSRAPSPGLPGRVGATGTGISGRANLISSDRALAADSFSGQSFAHDGLAGHGSAAGHTFHHDGARRAGAADEGNGVGVLA
jgi:hypothetical protein